MSTLRAVPPASLNDQVAATVRAELARRRMTQQDLARAVGLSQASVSERLRGKTPFSTDDIERVADALGIHPAVLFGGHGPLPTPPTTGRYSRKISTKRNALPTSRVVVGTPRELAAVA